MKSRSQGSQGPVDEYSVLVERQIDRLREQLLDLSNRNRLLNFKHPERSRKQARVIDELPSILYERLLSGRSFRFRAVEDPQELVAGARVPVAEAARRQGLNPTFDLGARPATDIPEQHSDSFIQLLHYPAEMARRLEGMRQEHLTSLQELGVPSLYAVFGFLEWYEKPDSASPLLSPLVLVPLEIDRVRERGNYQYRVTCTAEEPEPNRTLSFRLKQDIGLVLPSLEQLVESENIDEYFASVEAAVSGTRPPWRLRRFVTISSVSFARQVMYEDLAPERWARVGGRARRPLLRALLARVDAAALATADRPHVPLLITDADSTQVAAIQDALAGRSMVVKGPPGTGKSQTITNLIAAALAANKKVLFVAEKMAALEVVKKRLDDAGLSNFCLALHSTKAKKRDVLDALEASRQAHRAVDNGARGYDPDRHDGAMAVRELEEYLDAVGNRFGSLGSDARQLVWREQTVRERLGAVAPNLFRVVIPGAIGLSTEALQDAARCLGELEASIAAGGDLPGTSPWSFVSQWNPMQHSTEGALYAVRRWADSLDELVSPLVDLGWPADKLQPSELAELGAQLTDLTYAEANAPTGLVALMLDQEFSSMAEALANDLEARLLQARRVEAICSVEKALPHRTRLLALVRTLSDTKLLTEGMTLAEIPERVRRRKTAAEALKIAAEGLQAIATELALPGAWDKRAQRTILLTGKLAVEADREVLRNRVLGCLEDDVVALLEAGANTARALSAGRTQLDQRLTGWESLGARELRRHATTLRSTGFLARVFGSKYRASVDVYRSLTTGRAAAREVMASQLQKAAEQLEAEQKWLTDPSLSTACGPAFRGLPTDFRVLSAVAAWGATVRTAFPGTDAREAWARSFLFSADLTRFPLLTEFCERLGDKLLQNLDRFDADITETIGKAFHSVVRLEAALVGVAELGVDNRALVTSLAEAAHALEDVATIDARIDANAARPKLSGFWSKAKDPMTLRAAINAGATIRDIAFPQFVATWLLTAEFAERVPQAISLGRQIVRAAEQERIAREEARDAGITLADVFPPGIPIEKLRERLRVALNAGAEKLAKHVRYVMAREACRANESTRNFYSAIEEAGGPWTGLSTGFEWCLLRTLCAELMRRHPRLAREDWSGTRLARLRQRVREGEAVAVRNRRTRLISELAAMEVPQGRRTGARRDWTDSALLVHEIGKKKRNVPIRVLMGKARDAILALTPCLMMSPLSIAQFLEDPELEFDLLIVDEASQLRPEEALGALLRARQVVVVGDEQQLPPTSFFKRAEDDESEEDDEDDVEAESLLDLAMNVFGEPHVLRWHYRSRHESLIGFSNAQFYRGELVVAPSPSSAGPGIGVSAEIVRGLYQASTNEPEANRVVELVFDLMNRYPGRSIGVVAINQQQSDLIRERIDERIRDDAVRYIETWKGTLEPFFVKNLENVQGDERDIIVISMTYGPDETGRVYQRFGPIVSAHGHRRLNVLFSRAKHQLILVTSLRPEDIRAEVGSNRGVQVLRAYLEYAARRTSASRVAGRDSPFERLVREIRDLGFDVLPGVGAQSLELDLGVSHPDDPSSFVAGVEVDAGGSSAHIKSADRELTRPLVLGQLGWSVIQAWTSDWLREPATARGRLRDALVDACRLAGKSMPAPRAVVVSKPLDDASALPSSALLSSAPRLAVEVRAGDSLLSHLEVHGERIRVGRGQQCEIRIPDQYEEVGAQHLELRWDRSGFAIASVDPRAGIYIDGARVAQGSLAKARTYTIRLGLGAVVLRLAFGAPLENSKPPTPPSDGSGALAAFLGQIAGQLGADERQFVTAILENGQMRTTELATLLGKSPVRVLGMVRQVRKRLCDLGMPPFFEDVRMPDGEVMYRRTDQGPGAGRS